MNRVKKDDKRWKRVNIGCIGWKGVKKSEWGEKRWKEWTKDKEWKKEEKMWRKGWKKMEKVEKSGSVRKLKKLK